MVTSTPTPSCPKKGLRPQPKALPLSRVRDATAPTRRSYIKVCSDHQRSGIELRNRACDCFCSLRSLGCLLYYLFSSHLTPCLCGLCDSVVLISFLFWAWGALLPPCPPSPLLLLPFIAWGHIYPNPFLSWSHLPQPILVVGVTSTPTPSCPKKGLRPQPKALPLSRVRDATAPTRRSYIMVCSDHQRSGIGLRNRACDCFCSLRSLGCYAACSLFCRITNPDELYFCGLGGSVVLLPCCARYYTFPAVAQKKCGIYLVGSEKSAKFAQL